MDKRNRPLSLAIGLHLRAEVPTRSVVLCPCYVVISSKENIMKPKSLFASALAASLLLVAGTAEAGSHGGGHYAGGHGSSHKGGHYRNAATGNHYRHRR